MRSARGRLVRVAVLATLVTAAGVCGAAAQEMTVARGADGLHVRAPGVRLLEGDAAKRLRDGQSVRIDFTLEVLASRAGRVLARAEQRVDVSFDLWEQRFAVTRHGTPPRSVSQLSAPAAEAWCLDNLVVAPQALERARQEPFWIRLTHRVLEEIVADDRETPFSVTTLIDVFSRRRAKPAAGGTVEAGPFRLTD